MNILNINAKNEEIKYLEKGGLLLDENSFKTLNSILHEADKFYSSINFRMNEKRFEWRLSFQHEENKLKEEGFPAEFAIILQDTLRKELDYTQFFSEQQLRHMGIELLAIFAKKETHNSRKELMNAIGFLLIEERALNPIEFEEKMKNAGVKITVNQVQPPSKNEIEDIQKIYKESLKELQKEGNPLFKDLKENDYKNKYFKASILKSSLKPEQFIDTVFFDLITAAQINYIENTPLPNKNNLTPTQKTKMKP